MIKKLFWPINMANYYSLDAKYDKDFFEHSNKYKNVLDEIKLFKISDISEKKNIGRLLAQASAENPISSSDKIINIKNCINLETAKIEKLDTFICESVETVNQLSIVKNHAFNKAILKENYQFIDGPSMSIVESIKLARQNKTSINSEAGIDFLVENFKNCVNLTDLKPLIHLTSLATTNESLTCLCMHQDIVLAVGLKATLGVSFTLYNQGYFNRFLGGLTTDLNFKLLKETSYNFITKPSFILTCGFLMLGVNFPSHFISSNVTASQAINLLQNSLDVLQTNSLKLKTSFAEESSERIGKVFFALGKNVASAFSGFFSGLSDEKLQTATHLAENLKKFSEK